VALPFFEIADEVGTAKAGNVVVLGALLEATEALPLEMVDSAMSRVVKGEKWLEIDRRALERGREAMRAAMERSRQQEAHCHA